MTDPQPPVIDLTANADDQRHQALTYADERRWLAFEFITPGPPSTRRYVIRVRGVERRLRPEAVLPYVIAFADARGESELFPEESE